MANRSRPSPLHSAPQCLEAAAVHQTTNYFGPDLRRNSNPAMWGRRRMGGQADTIRRTPAGSSKSPAEGQEAVNGEEHKRTNRLATFATTRFITPPHERAKPRRLFFAERVRLGSGARAESSGRPVPASSRAGWPRSAPDRCRPQAFKAKGFIRATREALFHAAHDNQGRGATFGFFPPCERGRSLCRADSASRPT